MQVKLNRTDDQGWCMLWRNLMQGLGLYTTHLHKTTEFKHALINQELGKYGGRLVAVEFNCVTMEFDHADSHVEFQIVWG